MFKTFDKDLGSSDFLGETDPIDIVDIITDDSVHDYELKIFEENG